VVWWCGGVRTAPTNQPNVTRFVCLLRHGDGDGAVAEFLSCSSCLVLVLVLNLSFFLSLLWWRGV